MNESIVIALIGIVPSVLVAIVSIVSNNAIIKVKIEELEKHVNKHNQVVERTYTLERDLATYWSKYDNLNDRISKLEHENEKRKGE
jgi:Tfp pilus assembly protein PilE